MRVLVVDQDSASNLAITRSLRDLYTVDCVTNKGDSLDLLRANTYEVIVATERLEDGSGLELLGAISKKWPSVLRIFAAERQRLQLLRGRLGPFELFQTLAYPIDPEKLVATLQMAAAAQHGVAEQIELTAEAPAEEPEQQDDPIDLEQSDEFEEPRFARAGRASGPAQRARSAAPAPEAPRGHRARRNVEPNQANDLAAKFPGSGTIGPRRVASGGGSSGGLSIGSAGGAARSARPRSAASKAPPVRFPPLEQISPLEPPAARNSGVEFSEAAAMARAARSSYESGTDEFDTKRLATMIGGGVAVVAVVVFLAFQMFGSKGEAPKVAPPVVAHAPEYPPEVTDLVAQIEAALKADDFKTARVDVDKLRQLSPSHPRLDFFDGLLLSKSNAAANGRGAGKKNGKPGGSRSGSASSSDVTTAGAGASPAPTSPSAAKALAPDASTSLAPETPAGMTLANSAAAGSAPASSGGPAAAVPGVSAAPEVTAAAPPAAGSAAVSTASASRSPASAVPPAASAVPPGASAVPPGASAVPPGASAVPPGASAVPPPAAAAPAQTSPAPRRAGGEPPPVVQEAKLVRRVTPDYPSAAKKDSISGFVDLDVTVSKQGNVDDVTVVQSTPSGMFDKSAVTAVRKWKYDPRFVDGLASTAHLKVHLEFGPNK